MKIDDHMHMKLSPILPVVQLRYHLNIFKYRIISTETICRTWTNHYLLSSVLLLQYATTNPSQKVKITPLKPATWNSGLSSIHKIMMQVKLLLRTLLLLFDMSPYLIAITSINWPKQQCNSLPVNIYYTH